MSESLLLIQSAFTEITKLDPPALIVCPGCNSDNFIKWGSYTRIHPRTGQPEKMQRRFCKNEACPRKTFSILPHPFLPIVRFTLCTFLLILHLFEEKGETIAGIAQKLGVSWAVARRAVAFAQRLKAWMDRESKTAPWMPSPCLAPERLWLSFTRSFSWAFFPGR